MKGLIDEIREIPKRAVDCYKLNRKIDLPTKVPYIGMGSSYYAPLTLMYTGVPIYPFIASEYFYYLASKKEKEGVLISQSGESSETLWCAKRFTKFVSITNNPLSSLAKENRSTIHVDISAGTEKYSSTKTYINTLICLYLGHKINPAKAIKTLDNDFNKFKEYADYCAKKIFSYLYKNKVQGLYIIGSGPNMGTALEGSLTLSETTKLTWTPLSTAQYDHGPKETANNSVVVFLNSYGKDKERIAKVKKSLIDNSNALILELKEETLHENLSPVSLFLQLNLLMNYLADYMQVGDTFNLGGKITTFK